MGCARIHLCGRRAREEIRQAVLVHYGEAAVAALPDNLEIDAFICGGAAIKGCAFCGRLAGYQCDHPHPLLRERTCDKYLCEECRQHVGPNRDWCPDHLNNQMELL